MCTVKTPKVKEPTAKPVPYLTNPLLNGLQIGQSVGRNSLRTDLPRATTATPSVPPLQPMLPPGLKVPVSGGGTVTNSAGQVINDVLSRLKLGG